MKCIYSRVIEELCSIYNEMFKSCLESISDYAIIFKPFKWGQFNLENIFNYSKNAICDSFISDQLHQGTKANHKKYVTV